MREHIVPESEAFQGAGAHVFSNYVTLPYQVKEDEFALLGLQVEGNALLIGVEGHEVVAVEALTIISYFTSRIAAARGLYLDDVGTQPCEGLRARSASLELREVDYPYSVQCRSHVQPPAECRFGPIISECPFSP